MIHSLPFLSQLSSIIWIVFGIMLLGQVARKVITVLTKIYI